MPEESDTPQPTPTNYQRTAGGHLRWQPPTPEHLQEMLPAYEVLRILGQGGMGAVYQGRQKSLDRLVAIKILPPEAADNDMQFVERFKNEARTMAKMNHPAIVHVYDFGETTDGQLYIVMEFIDGTDVAKMISSQGKLSEEYALSITAHVCDALQYAHTQGVVHRDIKPANILINMEGQVKVADFGLAKATDPKELGLTKTNMAMGTPDFVSPEALMPGVPIDGRADLYAVGVMLFNMLTGFVPRGSFRMPGITQNTDMRFDKIIGKAMEMDRELRYQTAHEMRCDLDVILTTPAAKTGVQSIPPQGQSPTQQPVDRNPNTPPQQHPGPGSTPFGKPLGTNPAPKAQPAAKKSNFGLISGIAAALAVVAGAVFMFAGGGKQPEAKPTAQNEDVKATSPAASSTSKPALSSAPLSTVSVLDVKDTKLNEDRAKMPSGQEDPKREALKDHPPPATTSPPTDVLTFGGHRYQLLTEPLTGPKAKAKAEAMGGHLATLNTMAEIDFMQAKFAPKLQDIDIRTALKQILLGGYQPNGGGPWQWITGEPFELKSFVKLDHILDLKNTRDHYLTWHAGNASWDYSGDDAPFYPLIEWDDDKPGKAEPQPTATTTAPAAPVPAPPPAGDAAPPADPRLAQLESGYQAHYNSTAQKPFLTSVAALNQSYVANGIARMRAAAQAKGSLTEVTALDAEKAAIEQGVGVANDDAAETPESLKTLRATYRSALAKLTAERDAKAAPLLDLYLKALDVYISELTKAGKIENAKQVQALREAKAPLKNSVAATVNPAVPVPRATAPASNGPTAKVDPVSARQLAEWIFSTGGNLKIDPGDGRRSYFKATGELPVGKLDIVDVVFRSDGATEQQLALLTAARNLDTLRLDGTQPLKLDFLREHKKLLSLNLSAAVIGLEYWPLLGSLKQLRVLDLRGQVSDGQISQLNNLKELDRLTMEFTPTGTGFAGMKESKKLRFLLLGDNGSDVTDAGLNAIVTTFPALEECRLAGWDNPTDITNEGLKALFPLKSLSVLGIPAKAVDDAAIDHLVRLRSLKTLDLRGSNISDAGVEKLRKALPGCKVMK